MITGIFKEESNKRFLAIIDINGKKEECYLASSSKLREIYDLRNKEVLLKKNKGENTRTKYVVQALKDNENYIWLNLKELNNLYYEQILKENPDVFVEKKINKNLRIDFFDYNKQELIEIKGILSQYNKAKFPFFETKRFYRQLKEMYQWDYSKKLVIILMNPSIDEIEFNKEYMYIYNQLIKCINTNLKIEIYKIVYDIDFKLEKVNYEINNDILRIKTNID